MVTWRTILCSEKQVVTVTIPKGTELFRARYTPYALGWKEQMAPIWLTADIEIADAFWSSKHRRMYVYRVREDIPNIVDMFKSWEALTEMLGERLPQGEGEYALADFLMSKPEYNGYYDESYPFDVGDEDNPILNGHQICLTTDFAVSCLEFAK